MCNNFASCTGADTIITYAGLGLSITGQYSKDSVASFDSMRYDRAITHDSDGQTIVTGNSYVLQDFTVMVQCSPESLAFFNAHKSRPNACGDVTITNDCCTRGTIKGAVIEMTVPDIVTGSTEADYYEIRFIEGRWAA